MRGGDAEGRAVVVGAVVQPREPWTGGVHHAREGDRAVGTEDRLRGLDLQLQVERDPVRRLQGVEDREERPHLLDVVTFGSVTTARTGLVPSVAGLSVPKARRKRSRLRTPRRRVGASSDLARMPTDGGALPVDRSRASVAAARSTSSSSASAVPR